jgi:hypothetical protein
MYESLYERTRSEVGFVDEKSRRRQTLTYPQSAPGAEHSFPTAAEEG